MVEQGMKLFDYIFLKCISVVCFSLLMFVHCTEIEVPNPHPKDSPTPAIHESLNCKGKRSLDFIGGICSSDTPLYLAINTFWGASVTHTLLVFDLISQSKYLLFFNLALPSDRGQLDVSGGK